MERGPGNSELGLYETILQLLECPVCFNYVSPPLGQCVQGHVLCPSCFDRLDRCPVCRGGKSGAGALLLESIHGIIPLPCKYELIGCNILTKGKELKGHEKTCEFAPLLCPLRRLQCEWEGAKDDLVDHLKSTHPEQMIFSDSKVFFCKKVLDDSHLLRMVLFYVNDTLFRAYWQFDKKLALVKFAVCQLDKSKTEDEFFCSIALLNVHNEEESVKLITKCYVPNQWEQDTFENTHFVALHYDILRKSSNELGDIKYRIKIFKEDKLESINSMMEDVSLNTAAVST